MPTIFMSPTWFYGYDIAFELTFAAICLIIAFFAFRVYRASDQAPARLLGMGFLFISLAYIVQSIFNFLVLSAFDESVCAMVKLPSAAFLDSLGLYLHITLKLIGLAILLYMSLKSSKSIVLWVLLALTLVNLLLSKNVLITYYILSAVFLAVLAWRYLENFFSKKQKKTLLIALAFIFLFFGSIHFFLSVNHQLFYVIGNFLELAAYLLILVNLYLVLKR